MSSKEPHAQHAPANTDEHHASVADCRAQELEAGLLRLTCEQLKARLVAAEARIEELESAARAQEHGAAEQARLANLDNEAHKLANVSSQVAGGDQDIIPEERVDELWREVERAWAEGAHLGSTTKWSLFARSVQRETHARRALLAPGGKWTLIDNLRRTLGNIRDATKLADVRSLANLGLSFIDTQAAPVAEEYMRDARRWRAFIGSARIRMLGSAGLSKPEPDNYAHFGMEIWTKYSRDFEPAFLEQMDKSTALGVTWLIKYADVAAAAQESAAALVKGDGDDQ